MTQVRVIDTHKHTPGNWRVLSAPRALHKSKGRGEAFAHDDGVMHHLNSQVYILSTLFVQAALSLHTHNGLGIILISARQYESTSGKIDGPAACKLH